MISALGRICKAMLWRKSRTGWCVRLEWANGCHDLVCYRPDERRARRAAETLADYWSSPVSVAAAAPERYELVEISLNDWRLHAHRRACRASDCPAGMSAPDAIDGSERADESGGGRA